MNESDSRSQTPRRMPHARPSLLDHVGDETHDRIGGDSILASVAHGIGESRAESGERPRSRVRSGVRLRAAPVVAGLVILGAGALAALALLQASRTAPSITPSTAVIRGGGARGATPAAGPSVPVPTGAPGAPASVESRGDGPENDGRSAGSDGQTPPARHPLDRLALDETETLAAASAPWPRRLHARARTSPRMVQAPATALAGAPPAAVRAMAAPPARSADSGDADAELVAALITRLDRRGGDPVTDGPATAAIHGSATATATAEALRLCGSRADPVAVRRCRDAVCPSAAVGFGACSAPPTARAALGGLRSRGRVALRARQGLDQGR